jgi:signal transduction histidine kinase
LTKKVTPEELFRHIVEGAADALGADESSLMLVDGDALRVVAACEAEAHAPRWRELIRIGEGVAGLVAETGTPVLLNEGDDLSRFSKLTSKDGRIRSAVSVPLEVAGRVVGVLNANRLADGETFTEEDLAVLRLFASTAALAIDQATVLQRAQARSRALVTLMSVTESLSGGVEPQRAIAAVLPRLAAAFQPSVTAAFLGSGSDGRLASIGGWTADRGPVSAADLALGPLRLDREVARAFQRREPTWLVENPIEPDLTAAALPARVLLVPATDHQAATRCALLLGWDLVDRVLPAEDLRLLQGLARQIELALSRQDRVAAVGALEAEMAQARAHLVEVERLATIGQNMAGLVHDINAPLTALITLAQLIQKDSGEAASRDRAEQVVNAARRAQRLVRELLSMARPQPPTFEPVDLDALLHSAMNLERPQCAVSGLRLAADLQPDMPRVMADPHRLGQVVLNLLVNARQAMDAAEAGSTITVRTRRGQRTVEVLVEDDGPGVPLTHKAKIFDWFFTTKPPGEGTGLGLAVSREILLAHGGTLRLEDTPGGGATFVLELPLPASEAEAGK